MRFDRHDIDQLTSIYNINTLQDYAGYAKRHLEDTKQTIEKYLKAVYDQAQKVLDTEFKTYIKFERHVTWKGKVELYVACYVEPVLEGDRARHVSFPSHDHKRFNGNERKQAKEYAEELAKKYNVPIIKRGF